MSPIRMTWEQIKQAYPDEWVVLVDVDSDHELPRVLGGTVAGHSKSRRHLLVDTALRPGEGWAIKYTGRRAGPHGIQTYH